MTKEQAFAEIKKYEGMSDTDIISLGKKSIKAILDDMGGKLRVSPKRRVGNHWNSQVEGVYVSNGNIFVDIYFQGDSTDTNDCEYFDTFFTLRDNVRVTSYLGSARYSLAQRADVMRSFLIDYLYWKVIDREKIERSKRIEKLSHWKVVNPVVNYFYDYYGLKYKYDTWAYGGKSVEYEAYNYANKELDAYIADNLDRLEKLSEEELENDYKEFFGKKMREYINKH